MTHAFCSISEVIDAWPTIGEFAADAGCGYEAARQMRRRGSIPPGYWVRIVGAAERRGIEISYQLLAELAAQELQEAAE